MPSDLEIFGEVLDAPPTSRSAILERACGPDQERRARIESLLEAYDSAGEFLQGSPIEPPAPRPEAKPGDTIGRYTLVRKLGEGGCGTVYLAEQKVPVRRQVALKVIKLGMDTRAIITRFEGERQALAMMDHPDIARVFDAGATETGRPFFAMEFVDGVPIAKFCDEHNLPLAARLALFVRVCTALQHAHQKGIIHRDVKPSNILVALRDGEPAPKVIDFGIAKATQERLTEDTLVTGVDQFIGTPAYMSPEQADRRDGDIDTRTDVYALGVVLYELLTGQLPFNPRTLAQAGVPDLRRILRETEPPRPSQRLADLPAPERSETARQRGCTPAQLAHTLRGDLDWIVLRCLEKERARRYGTAQELAEDVRRHLRSEPVEARPPSQLYRTQRFIARHRLACASAAAIGLTLIGATIVSVRQAIVATQAREAAEAAGRAETLARSDAQQRQQQAEQLLSFLLSDVSPELKKFSSVAVRGTLGDRAMDYFAAVPPEKLTDTEVARQSKALTQIGEIKLDEAKYTEAADAFTKAYESAATLTTRHPRNADMLFERAQAEYWIGYVARLRGDFPKAREWLTRYRDSATALFALEGPVLRAQREAIAGHHNLAVLDMDLGALENARSGFVAELAAIQAMRTANPDNIELKVRAADVSSWIGRAAEYDGRYAEALESYNAMKAGYEELAMIEPSSTRWQVSIAQSLNFLADIKSVMGNRGDPGAHNAHARQLFDRLVARDGKNRQWQLGVIDLVLQRAESLVCSGQSADAAPLLADARGKLEALVAAEPTSRAMTRHLAEALRLEAQLGLGASDPGAAGAIKRAVDLSESLFAARRADVPTRGQLARSRVLAGRLALALGKSDEARGHWIRALEVLGDLKQTNDWRLLDPAIQVLALLGRDPESRPLRERLQRFGYHAEDPFTASILEASSQTENQPTAPKKE